MSSTAARSAKFRYSTFGVRPRQGRRGPGSTPIDWRSSKTTADGRIRTVDDLAADDRGDDLERADLVGRGRGDIATQDRHVAYRAARQVTAPGRRRAPRRRRASRPAVPARRSAAGRSIHGGVSGLVRTRPSIPAAIWSTGRPRSSVRLKSSGKVHGASVADATCSPASTKSRQRAIIRHLVGVLPVEPGQEPLPEHPVGLAVEVDDRRDVHRYHPGELLVGDLDGVLDPMVERVRAGRAYRRLVRVEEHVDGRGAHRRGPTSASRRRSPGRSWP